VLCKSHRIIKNTFTSDLPEFLTDTSALSHHSVDPTLGVLAVGLRPQRYV